MQIQILDAIECRVSRADGELLFPCLSFESVYWKQGPFKRQRKTYQKSVFSFKGKEFWRFYTGLLPRIRQWCVDQGIPLEVVGEEIRIKRQNPPFLKGVTFRDDQLAMIDVACSKQRGVIQSPTGSGKTIMQLGLMSCYTKARILLLAHSNDITSQTFNKLQEFGFKDSELFGGGNLISKPTKRIVVSSMQSFVKLPIEDYMTYFDIILLDEAHHLQIMKSKDKNNKQTNTTYVEILSHMLAPIRIGWTATTRTNDEAVLVSEGLLGKVIGKMTVEEAAELEILARPRLRFIKAKCSPAVMDLRKYSEVYEFAVVRNKPRNQQIAKCAKEFYDKGETTLIFVTQIAHGELIAEEIKSMFKIDVPFVQGIMPQKERNKVKNALIKKMIKICIATTSWSEGVDIQNLDSVIVAAGGKSEIQTLQRVGRGLRKTDGKDTATIVDILDLSHNHLLRQLGERLAIYSDMGWL